MNTEQQESQLADIKVIVSYIETIDDAEYVVGQVYTIDAELTNQDDIDSFIEHVVSHPSVVNADRMKGSES